MNNIWLNIAGVIGSFGGAGIVVFALSSWLGKVWATRVMDSERAKHSQELERLRASLQADNAENLSHLREQLDIFKSKYLTAHFDKIATYRMATDIVAALLSNIDRFYEGSADPNELPKILHEFHLGRMRVYGYLAILAPQGVMDAMDNLMDHLIKVLAGSPYVWKELRVLILKCVNEIRIDIGIDKSPIEYRGAL